MDANLEQSPVGHVRREGLSKGSNDHSPFVNCVQFKQEKSYWFENKYLQDDYDAAVARHQGIENPD